MKHSMKMFILCVLLLVRPVYTYYGKTTAAFLNLTASVRSEALAGASTTLEGSAESLFANDSGLVRVRKNGFFSSFSLLMEGVNYGAFSYVRNVSNYGSFGTGLFLLSSGPIDSTALESGRVVALGTDYDIRDLYFKISWARLIPRTRLRAGGGVKVARNRVEGTDALSTLVDAGCVWEDPIPGLSVGASVKNLGFRFTYRKSGEPAPVSFTGGTSYKKNLNSGNTLMGIVDLIMPIHETAGLSAGVEYGLRDILFFRAGYSFFSQSRGVSFGLGFQLPSGGERGIHFPEGKSVRLDCAWLPYDGLSESGTAQTFRVGAVIEF